MTEFPSGKVVVVAGARPNFMKVAPLLTAFERRKWQTVLVHTGQHFDAAMSERFFADLGMEAPDYHLGVGAGSHAEQTARVMERFDAVLESERPEWVVVVGDVNSTLAAALVTAKQRPVIGCRLAHVEAGLRSGDWRMPEEVNRVVTDQVSDLLLTHSPEAADHLVAEGIAPERIAFVGNVMIDSLLATLDRFPDDAPWTDWGLARGQYGLVTLHRPSNVDDSARLETLLRGLGRVSGTLPLLWPVHPRARAQLGQLVIPPRLQLVEPAGYRQMVHLVAGSAVVITDSGGLQEETTALGVPCVTLRETTERPVTITRGTSRLVPWPPTEDSIATTVAAALRDAGHAPPRHEVPGWDGHAADRVVAAITAAQPQHGRCSVIPAGSDSAAIP